MRLWRKSCHEETERNGTDQMRQTLAAATAFLAFTLAASQPIPASAQNTPFAPRVMVNDKSITFYEYDQRLRFMTLLNAPGDLAKEAERTLIDDRLRLETAQRLKIRIAPKAIETGMAEFAARFELPLEKFIEILQANGVVAETFRDFVHAGLAWREVVKAKFGPTALASIYEPEVDRAMGAAAQASVNRALLSEIELRTDDRNLANELSRSLKGEAAFAAAARRHSLATTAADGGRTGWRDAASMPMQILAAIEGLKPGQVSAPIRLPEGRYGIYLMRDIELGKKVVPQNTSVDYARLMVGPAGDPATNAAIARLRSAVDNCLDLNGEPGQLTRQTTLQSQLPGDVATALAALDDNEITTFSAGGAAGILMLCARRIDSATEPHRDTIRGRLAEARVGGQADLYLQQLRSNAHIRKP